MHASKTFALSKLQPAHRSFNSNWTGQAICGYGEISAEPATMIAKRELQRDLANLIISCHTDMIDWSSRALGPVWWWLVVVVNAQHCCFPLASSPLVA